MNKRFACAFGGCLLALGLSACGDGGRPHDPDVVTPVEEAGTDAGDVVVVRPDAARDAVGSDVEAGSDAGVDAAASDPCAAASVVDLLRVGTRSGGTTTYTGSTNGLTQASTLPPACITSVGYELAFRYQVMSAAHLRVTTRTGGTAAEFDTVIWALTQCDGRGTVLGCNDDLVPGDRHSTFTTLDALPAGSDVYLVLAGYVPPHPMFTPTGAFELSVTEVPEVPTGGECDATGVANVCAAAVHCIADSTPAHCIADGALGGQCTIDRPGCTAPGVACSGDRLNPASRCVPQVGRGQPCDPMVRMNVCVVGTTCVMGSAGPTCM